MYLLVTFAVATGGGTITGATQTTNATLTVGSITLAQSQAFAPNAEQTKNIGDTAIATTGFRLTAGAIASILHGLTIVRDDAPVIAA